MDRYDFISNIDKIIDEKKSVLDGLRNEFRDRFKKEVPEAIFTGVSGTATFLETGEKIYVNAIRKTETVISGLSEDKETIKQLGDVIKYLDKNDIDKHKLNVLAKYAPVLDNDDDEYYDYYD